MRKQQKLLARAIKERLIYVLHRQILQKRLNIYAKRCPLRHNKKLHQKISKEDIEKSILRQDELNGFTVFKVYDQEQADDILKNNIAYVQKFILIYPDIYEAINTWVDNPCYFLRLIVQCMLHRILYHFGHRKDYINKSEIIALIDNIDSTNEAYFLDKILHY